MALVLVGCGSSEPERAPHTCTCEAVCDGTVAEEDFGPLCLELGEDAAAERELEGACLDGLQEGGCATGTCACDCVLVPGVCE
jgi:hypothetical protein